MSAVLAGLRRLPPLRFRHPGQYIATAFVGASLVGTGLLLLPPASHDPGPAPLLTALFTATSAVCVTGLVVVDTGTYWTGFGQVIILALIQIGGLGIMTMSSLVAVLLARRIGLRHRLVTAAEKSILELGDVRELAVRVAVFSLLTEVVVALVLGLRFWMAHDAAAGRAATLGVFHAVSAFNNAGFSLFRDSLAGVALDPFLLLVVAAAVITGGLGYPVWVDIARRPRRPGQWSLHAKLTVSSTLVLLVAGWALLTWFEWTNPRTLGGMSVGDSIVNAFFHSVTPRTAGFETLQIADLREPSRLLTEVLMFIGGGSASTAGGIKVTTFALLGWVMWAEARGDPDVVVFDRRVPGTAQRQALTVALLAVGVVVAATMALMSLGGLPRDDLFFETVSALGTVGLSTGVTPSLSTGSQLLVVGLMLLGRVGPVTLFAALVLRERVRRYRHPEERPIIG